MIKANVTKFEFIENYTEKYMLIEICICKIMTSNIIDIVKDLMME